MDEAPRDLSTATLPRLHVEAVLAAGAAFDLPAPQSHYLAQVMRRQVGDFVLVFDGRSGEWRARVASVGKRAVGLVVEAQTRQIESVPDLWLCAAPLKRGRIDWLAEKACELGVARLLPVLTRRTVVDRLNHDRLFAHMIEAAEQCGRTALPDLAEPIALPALLAAWPPERALIFADETGGAPLAASLAAIPAPAAILIGPEGGFTPEERAAIRALPQTRAVSLGPRILRADTAAVAAIAVWQAVQAASADAA
ncbi:16S rRNA methyltransferase [alpha proteobacterium AAP81b]|nr:16S rRNA methyltransferase [alpha proteobacterium AAP81b]